MNATVEKDGPEVDMRLDYRQWTQGGTMITNFNIKLMPAYKLAVERSGNPALIVSDLAYCRGMAEPYEGMGSLHHLIEQEDLSDFWQIYQQCKVELNLVGELG